MHFLRRTKDYMISFPDHILTRHRSADVIRLVNEFLAALRHTRGIRQLPTVCRPYAVKSREDIAAWLSLIALKITERGNRGQGADDAVFALQLVLEAAIDRLDGLSVLSDSGRQQTDG